MVGNHSRQILRPQWSFLCSVNAGWTIPYPNGIQPPVWLFRLGCTPYAASTHVHEWLRLSDLIIFLSLIFCFRYFNTRLDLALSYLLILVTLVHRNYKSGSISVLPPFYTHSIFATIEWRMFASFFLVLWKSHLCSANNSLPAMILSRLAIPWKINLFLDVIFHG